MSKDKKPFNNPFAKLKLPESESSQDATSPDKKNAKKKKAPKPPPPPAPKHHQPSSNVSTDDSTMDVYERKLFLDAVGDVKPVENQNRHVEPESFTFTPSNRQTQLEDAMALEELHSLVGANTSWTFERDGEYVEGRIASVSHQILRSLKRGENPPLSSIDLHGSTVPEALRKLKSWIFETRASGVRSGLIITGRGHHSDDGIAILQKEIPDALMEPPLSSHLLAFASAQPKDGGPGALYVLLKKRQTKS